MDECFLDVTASQVLYGSGKEIADQIRCRMKNELGLTVSIGISFNKIFAKLGSDMKKPDAITSIEESEWKQKVWPLRVSELLFCGRLLRSYRRDSKGSTKIGRASCRERVYVLV